MCFPNLKVKEATESNFHRYQKSLDKRISVTYGTHGLNLQSPPEAHVLSTCSLLVVIFGKAIEPSGSPAFLEEVDK